MVDNFDQIFVLYVQIWC